MESKTRKLPQWMTSPKKSEDKPDSPESPGGEGEKPVVHILSPSELEEIARSILSEKKLK